MFSVVRVIIAALCFLLLPGGCSRFEQPPGSEAHDALPPAVGQLSEGFTMPSHVIERADGRVLISDPPQREVWLADFGSGELTRFGSRGDGPGEFRSVHQLLPWRGDSVAVIAHGIPYRIAVLSGEGRPIRTRFLGKQESPELAAFGFEEYPQLSRADAKHRFYGARLPMTGSAAGVAYLDSVPVMRLRLDQQPIDTVAMFGTGEQAASRLPNRGNPQYTVGKGLFAAVNDWTVLEDGTILTIDAATYRLTLIEEDGSSRTVSVQHQHPAYAVDQAQWERYVDSAAQAGARRLQNAMGQMSAMMGKTMDAPQIDRNVVRPERPTAWPPVLTVRSRMKQANGLLWIPVSGPESPSREYWDVVSIDGTVLRSLVLEAGAHLREVTSCWVYTAARDSDDLYWLRRHPNAFRATSDSLVVSGRQALGPVECPLSTSR